MADTKARIMWMVLYFLTLTETVQGLVCYYNYEVLGVVLTRSYLCYGSEVCCGREKCCSSYGIYRLWYFWFCAVGGVIFVSILFAVYFHNRNKARRVRIGQGRANAIPLRQQGAQIIISQQQQQGPSALSYPHPPPQAPSAPRPPYNPQFASPSYCPPQMPPPPYSTACNPGVGPPGSVAPRPMNPGYQKNVQQF